MRSGSARTNTNKRERKTQCGVSRKRTALESRRAKVNNKRFYGYQEFHYSPLHCSSRLAFKTGAQALLSEEPPPVYASHQYLLYKKLQCEGRSGGPAQTYSPLKVPARAGQSRGLIELTRANSGRLSPTLRSGPSSRIQSNEEALEEDPDHEEALEQDPVTKHASNEA